MSTLTPEAIKKLKQNPSLFAQLILDFKPFSYQEQLLNDPAKRVIACMGRQTGKTTTIATKAIHYAYAHKNTTPLIISPSLRQSMIMFDKILTLTHQNQIIRRSITRKTRTIIQLTSASTIVALPCSEHLLRGYTANLAICDEASFIPETIITEILYPMLSTTNGTAILLSTPWDKNHFFYKAFLNPAYSTHKVRSAENPRQWWLLDEFTSTLDRDTAKTVAYNLQKLARQRGKAVIAATTHTDLLKDLAPDVHVHKRYGKELAIRYYPNAQARGCSLTRQMRVEQGTLQDYKALSQFHYRAGRCPPPRKIFVLKRRGELCGVIVYGFPSPVCFGRSRVWKGSLQRLQREVSVISRVVVHPKYRSIGLGAKLVHETLARAGTACVEAVAVMARYNPFFERAGMRRIAESKPSPHVTAALERLGELGFDSALLAGVCYGERVVSEVGREAVLEVLEELSRRDAGVRRRLVGLRNVYPRHEEFMAKATELDVAGLAKALKRLSFMAQTKVYLFWSKKSAED